MGDIDAMENKIDETLDLKPVMQRIAELEDALILTLGYAARHAPAKDLEPYSVFEYVRRTAKEALKH